MCPGGARVMLATDVAGKPAVALGSVGVKEGTTTNVSIPLKAKLTTGRYFVLLEPSSASPTAVGAPLASALVTVDVT